MSAESIRAGSAYVELLLKDRRFREGLAKNQTRLQAWVGKINLVGRAMQNAAKKGLAMTAALGAPFAAAIKFASDAQETMSKFSVVFGAATDEMARRSDTLAKRIGRSRYEIRGTVASFQDLLVPMGVTNETAREMSLTLAQLGVDLGSFNNVADADVVRDLQAALTGSGETMKKYGVVVSEAAVKQELLNQQINPRDATVAAKAQARLAIILRGTVAAQGDAERTAGGFANRMKELRGRVRDAAAEIGESLLPAATQYVELAIRGVKVVADFAAKHRALVVSLASAVTIVGTLSLAVYGLGAAFTAASVAATAASAAVKAVSAALTFLYAHPFIAGAAIVAGIIIEVAGGFDYLADKIGLSADESERLAGNMEKVAKAGDQATRDKNPGKPQRTPDFVGELPDRLRPHTRGTPAFPTFSTGERSFLHDVPPELIGRRSHNRPPRYVPERLLGDDYRPPRSASGTRLRASEIEAASRALFSLGGLAGIVGAAAGANVGGTGTAAARQWPNQDPSFAQRTVTAIGRTVSEATSKTFQALGEGRGRLAEFLGQFGGGGPNLFEQSDPRKKVIGSYSLAALSAQVAGGGRDPVVAFLEKIEQKRDRQFAEFAQILRDGGVLR
ncbi:MAG: hypothetical protein CMJ58_16875 [Planctomycetaceae bacterium]|nr:hypothetical protein [Planctomycetaceae bacterium]